MEIVLVLTYAIALGDCTHVIAGSGEVIVLIFPGALSWVGGFAGLPNPTLAGNVVGGTGLLALPVCGQIREEL